MREPLSVHLFCEVVDNYGDAGVCWRLSRALAERGCTVSLWIDDLVRLQRLRPALDAARDDQQTDGFTVRRWLKAGAGSAPDRALGDASACPAGSDSAAAAGPADLVVAAFGCRLPGDYLAAMAARTRPPVWVNLEYLSAEDWVERSHALPSPHPRLKLTEYFYFPGFVPGTGGLLKERAYDDARRAFGPEQRCDFLAGLGLDTGGYDSSRSDDDGSAGAAAVSASAPVVSLFCYPTAHIEALFEQMAQGPAVHCLVPAGVTPLAPSPGQRRTSGALTLHGVPFLEPDDYDRLLWSCDLNFVRGEDSAVRAQWAGQPMLWQLYPQSSNAHHAKLDAFLARYTAQMPAQRADLLAQAMRVWNGDHQAELPWPDLLAALPALRAHARQWSQRLGAQQELASGLIEFARKIG